MIDEKLFEHCLPLDLETSGLDPDKHGMLSAGISHFNGEELYVENRLRHSTDISEEALKVNGFTRSEISRRNRAGNFPSEDDALQQILDFADRNRAKVILGKNPRFDYGFLKSIWERRETSAKFPLTYRVLDYGAMVATLMILSGHKVPIHGISSSAAQEFLGINEEPMPHNALTGARYNKECIIKLFEKFQEIKDL